MRTSRRPLIREAVFTALIATMFAHLPGCADDAPTDSRDLPVIRVIIDHEMESADAMDAAVSVPLERSLASLPGLELTQSVSEPHQSTILLQFEAKHDTFAATKSVEDALKAAMPLLPKEAQRPRLDRRSPDQLPLVYLALKSNRRPEELNDVAFTLRRDLLKLPGVGEVECHGAATKAVNIELDCDRLAAHGAEALDVERQLSALGEKGTSQPAPPLGFWQEAAIARGDRAPLRLTDIANFNVVSQPTSTALMNRQRVVAFTICGSFGSDNNALIAALRERLPILNERLPPDVKLEIAVDLTMKTSRILLVEFLTLPMTDKDDCIRYLTNVEDAIRHRIRDEGSAGGLAVIPHRVCADGIGGTLILATPRHAGSSSHLKTLLHEICASAWPGAQLRVTDLSTQDLPAYRYDDVRILLQGPTWSELQRFGEAFGERLRKSDIVANVRAVGQTPIPYLQAVHDEAKIRAAGLSAPTLDRFVRLAIVGRQVGKFSDEYGDHHVRLSIAEKFRADTEDLSSLVIAKDGPPLRELIAFKTVSGLPAIRRYNGRRSLEIAADIRAGVTEDRIRERCLRIADEVRQTKQLPPEYHILVSVGSENPR